MATVTYDDGSFSIDSTRLWLVSGSIHYFRVPSALWRDRLLKAKRAGLNCISTSIAWNQHEPREGKWASGDQCDLQAFVRLADEVGLKVILKPGPFIGQQVDFGGMPGWLAAKTGVALRSNNAVFTHYFDKYFRHVLPRLAEMQVTRGGNIVLIQAEHHFTNQTMPERAGYLEFINQLFRRSGFDIPIISCNDMTDPAPGDTIETVSQWDTVVGDLKRLRARQPGAPLLVSELRNGRHDIWGGEHDVPDARTIARRAMEVLGCGAQFNYTPWHGGTNFGFTAGRDGRGPAAYVTTSFDCGAPLAEGGGLTEAYYTTRLVNLLAQHMGEFLASSYVQEPVVSVHDSTATFNLVGSRGRWAVVTNNGRDDIATATISLHNGCMLDVPLEPIGAAAIPVNLQLTEQHRLDYANITPLGFFNQKVLVLHGPAGWPARISIDGRLIEREIPDADEPELIEVEELVVVLINSSLAQRTWPTDEALILGPTFVDEDPSEVTCPADATQYALIDYEGKLSHKKAKSASGGRKPSSPHLGKWKCISVCSEPLESDLQWQRLDRPRDVDQLGIHTGYVWYRVDFQSPRARKVSLCFPQLRDRAVVYVNSLRAGTWGQCPGDTAGAISASLKKGDNSLTLLVDNLGRADCENLLDDPKGLFGHIYDGKVLRTGKFKLKPVETFPKRIVPRNLAYMIDPLSAGPIWEASVSLTLTKVAPIHLAYHDLPHHVAIFCNERTAAFLPQQGSGFGEVVLGSELKKGKNVLKLLLWGDVQPAALDNVTLTSLLESLSQGGKVSCRPWQMPDASDSTTGRDRPAWYQAAFKYTPCDAPLFVRIGTYGKGQLFLNGHNLGRFWSIGPQKRYFLPECWLQEKNELLIFTEDGRCPSKWALDYCPEGGFTD